MNNDKHPLSPLDVRLLSAFVEGKASALPESIRCAAIAHIWSQTHSAFNVRCAAELTLDQLRAVHDFIANCGFDESLGLPMHISPIQRYMVYADASGTRQVQPIPHDAQVMNHPALLRALKTPGDLALSSNEVFELICAAAENLRRRSSALRKPILGRRIAISG